MNSDLCVCNLASYVLRRTWFWIHAVRLINHRRNRYLKHFPSNELSDKSDDCAVLRSHPFQPSSTLTRRRLNESSDVLELECFSRVFQCATLLTKTPTFSTSLQSFRIAKLDLAHHSLYFNSKLYCWLVVLKFLSICWSFVSSIACLLWQRSAGVQSSPVQIHLLRKFQPRATLATRSALGSPNW